MPPCYRSRQSIRVNDLSGKSATYKIEWKDFFNNDVSDGDACFGLPELLYILWMNNRPVSMSLHCNGSDRIGQPNSSELKHMVHMHVARGWCLVGQPTKFDSGCTWIASIQAWIVIVLTGNELMVNCDPGEYMNCAKMYTISLPSLRIYHSLSLLPKSIQKNRSLWPLLQRLSIHFTCHPPPVRALCIPLSMSQPHNRNHQQPQTNSVRQNSAGKDGRGKWESQSSDWVRPYVYKLLHYIYFICCGGDPAMMTAIGIVAGELCVYARARTSLSSSVWRINMSGWCCACWAPSMRCVACEFVWRRMVSGTYHNDRLHKVAVLGSLESAKQSNGWSRWGNVSCVHQELRRTVRRHRAWLWQCQNVK